MTRKEAVTWAMAGIHPTDSYSYSASEAAVERAIEAGVILGLRMAAKLKPNGIPVHSFNGGFYAHAEQCADLATKREKRLKKGK